MAAEGQEWDVRLTDMARADFRGIIDWTAGRFGDSQAKTYARTITAALRTLRTGPGTVGVRARDDLGNGVLILPVARSGRRGRHLIVFRVAPGGNANTIQILRILYDAMDLPRHVAVDDEAES